MMMMMMMLMMMMMMNITMTIIINPPTMINIDSPISNIDENHEKRDRSGKLIAD